MRSTFAPGQTLYIHPESSEPQPGDVVVFSRGEGFTVHRVVKVTGSGLITRGDNNPRPDDAPVSPEQVVGVVDQVGEGDSTTSILRGQKALQKAQIRWKWMALTDKLRPVFGAPYRWLKQSRLIYKFWHPEVTRLEVNALSERMVKYIVRGKTIATWQPDSGRFECKRIYDLVIFPPGR
jgi:signal peptidase I